MPEEKRLREQQERLEALLNIDHNESDDYSDFLTATTRTRELHEVWDGGLLNRLTSNDKDNWREETPLNNQVIFFTGED